MFCGACLSALVGIRASLDTLSYSLKINDENLSSPDGIYRKLAFHDDADDDKTRSIDFLIDLKSTATRN